MPIKDLLADVTAVTTDIGDCAITSAKVGGAMGKFVAFTLTGNATSGYVTLLTATGATTVFFGCVTVTAAGTSGTVTIQGTAAENLIPAISCSAAAATYLNQTAANSIQIVPLADGASLCALYDTGTATANFRANGILGYIETPT